MYFEFVDCGAAMGSLTVEAVVAWLIVFRHAADRRLAVSVRKIQESTGMPRPTILAALSELKTKGFLRATRPGRYQLSPTAKVG
jgi:DNA-binding IclR family transcriptional regulator